ncbi:conserved hypothetical protein [Sinorhizobium medicae]|uniref:Uncharacterized protein n=1 Tax=Sinorhizobium medicae TaxID=110321 RepID=A0A508X7R8_9HYPH|nr:conserved hypothetical protein [Sinorhizobium medicae]
MGLDGETFFVDANGHYRVKFVVKRVKADERNPHGLNYSPCMISRASALSDSIMPIQSPTQGGPAGKKRVVNDHRHRFKTIRPYDYKDAATLLEDFWAQVDSVLKEEGVIS